MIETGAKNENNVDISGDARLFSRLKIDEKFLAHLAAIESNLKVSDEELSKRAQQTNADMTQQVFDLIGATNEFLR